MSIPRVPNRPSADLVRRQADAINRTLKNTNGLSSSETSISIDRDLNLATGKVYKINSVQVVGARATGWAADTGTDKRTANATYTAGATLTFSAAYVQAELTALATRLAAVETALQNATRTQKSLKADLTTHGLIGS